MRKLLILFKDKLHSNFWLYPSALFLFFIALAWGTILLDFHAGDMVHPFLKDFLFFNELSLATARTYLATLIGAIITVVGIVFSLTMLTVSTASSQFGPRILNNFMRDRANQVTLGVYTSTFVFATTVLLSLYEKKGAAFIPYISIFISFILALLCVGFLIFFIHHIPTSLRIENIVHRIAKSVFDMVEKRYPRKEGVKVVELEPGEARLSSFKELIDTAKHPCGRGPVGYVQVVDLERLVELAKKHKALLVLKVGPGQFVNGESLLVCSDIPLDTEVCDKINSAFLVGADRTPPQNIMYLLSQLMEIAIRSMSPGINDPITAMSCVDWLEACILKLMDKDSSYAIILDSEDNPRLVVRPVGSEEVLFHLRKSLAEHMSKNYATALHMMESLERLYKHASSDQQKSYIKACAAELLAFSKEGVPVKGQISRLAEIFRSFTTPGMERLTALH